VLSETDREHLASNIIGHMSQSVERAVQERALKLWYQVDRELGAQVAKGLGLEYTSTLPTPVGEGQRK
jgi:catalase